MRKIGNVVLLIAGILAIFAAVASLAGAIAFIVFSSPQYTSMILEGLQNGTIHSTLPGTPEQVAAQIQAMFLIFGIVLAVEVAIISGSAAVAFLAKSKQTSGLYIANIVLGVLSGSVLLIVGGILGLVGRSE